VKDLKGSSSDLIGVFPCTYLEALMYSMKTSAATVCVLAEIENYYHPNASLEGHYFTSLIH
jgi:hypothetical protein